VAEHVDATLERFAGDAPARRFLSSDDPPIGYDLFCSIATPPAKAATANTARFMENGCYVSDRTGLHPPGQSFQPRVVLRRKNTLSKPGRIQFPLASKVFDKPSTCNGQRILGSYRE
jgi:hypothetical protein